MQCLPLTKISSAKIFSEAISCLPHHIDSRARDWVCGALRKSLSRSARCTTCKLRSPWNQIPCHVSQFCFKCPCLKCADECRTGSIEASDLQGVIDANLMKFHGVLSREFTGLLSCTRIVFVRVVIVRTLTAKIIFARYDGCLRWGNFCDS